MGKYTEARNAYRKALELEPNNDSFSNNLKIAEEKIRENAGRSNAENATPLGGVPGFAGAGFNPLELLNNPAFAEMTQRLITDPNMTNMFGNLFGSMGGGNTGPTTHPTTDQQNATTDFGANPTPGQENATPGSRNVPPVSGLNHLLEMGQRFASMMQQQNPELVEQLRRQFQQDDHPNQDDSNNRPNPN